METLIFGFAIVVLSVAGLGLGVVFGRAPLKGSCGGVACIDKIDCEVCPRRKEARS